MADPMAGTNGPLWELNRLLSRLQQSTLLKHTQRQQRLTSNEFERAKADTSIRHARILLTTLEQEATSIKVHAQRQGLQADLNQTRKLIEDLAERMRDLGDMTDSHDSEDPTLADDDILSALGSMGGTTLPRNSSPDLVPPSEPPSTIPGHQEAAAAMGTAPDCALSHSNAATAARSSHTLRSRAGLAQPGAGTTTITATGRSLLGNSDAKPTAVDDVATSESVLDQQRAEQDILSESMLRMASSLKASSEAFASALDEDRSVLGRAGESLGRNELGLGAAARGMGALTKMTEREGFIARMKLYVLVYGLMVLLILLVFIAPKLRL